MEKKEKIFKEYPLGVSSNVDVVSEANMGVYASNFFDFANASGYTKDTLANLLNISVKTLSRYKESKTRMSPQNSEHLIKLFILYRKGIEVFSNIVSFNRWLEKPSYGLGGAVPFSFLNTISGIDLVLEELTKIEYGDLA